MDLATARSLHSLQNQGLEGNKSEFGRQSKLGNSNSPSRPAMSGLGRVEANDQTKFTGDIGLDTAPRRIVSKAISD